MNFSTIANLRGLRAGANSSDVSGAEQKLSIRLPSDYIQVLMFSDGCLLENGLSLYPLENLAERNQTHEVFQYTPGYLLIGDDSGGMGVLLSFEASPKSVYASGIGDLSPSGFKVIASSHQALIDGQLAL